MSLYLLINILVISVPLALTWDKKVSFYKKLKSFLPALFLSAFVFLVWDVIFVNRGIWGFNSNYILSVQILHLPIEEILFFITIPYACAFIYETFRQYHFYYHFNFISYIYSAVLILSALLLLIFHPNNLYTTITVIFTVVIVILSHVIIQPSFHKHFYTASFISMIPFIATNGVLTGTGIENEIVWYNSQEISEIRLLTIPIEDIFYFHSLFLLNIILFELFMKRSRLKFPAI